MRNKQPEEASGGKSRKCISHFVIIFILVLLAASLVVALIFSNENEVVDHCFSNNEEQQQIRDLERKLEDCTNQTTISANEMNEIMKTTASNKLSKYHTGLYEYYFSDSEYGDQTLMRRHRATGEEEIVIESTYEALPALTQRTDGNFLTVFSHPWNSDQIYFASILNESDSGPLTLFRFDIPSLTISKMDINSIFGVHGAIVFSQDGTQAVYIPNEGTFRTMYVLDFVKDTSKKIVSLPVNETFSSVRGSFGPRINAQWNDTRHIQYGVYDINDQLDEHEVLGIDADNAQVKDFRTIAIDE